MKLRTILTLILAVLAGSASAQPQPRGDDTLLDMAQAFRRNDKARLAQLLPAARGHALEPWAAYWELRARLDTATPQEVQEFLARYAGTYQEDRLRNDWLLLLGQRRDFTTFEAEYPRFRMNDDPQVRCYALLVQSIARPDTTPAAAEEVRKLWLGLRELDDGCTLAASRLLTERGKLTPADAWRKARLATEFNRPKVAAAAVEMIAPEALPQLSELHASPSKFLTGKHVAVRKLRRELITLALVRLAGSDADNAAQLLDRKWSSQLSDEERNWIWGVLGRQAAQKLDPVALQYYAKVTRDTDLTDTMLEWKVRAALRGSDGAPQWPLVLSTIDAMGEHLRADPAWRYWRARALLASGTEAHRAEATRLLEALASPRGFYEQLASEELGQRIAPPPRPAPLTAEEKEAVRLNPSLNRGLYAISIGLRNEGVREWNYGTNLAQPGGLPERQLLAAAQFACDREVWDRCINTSERTRNEFDLEQRYPMPFRDTVIRRAAEVSLDPAYVYGLIRQESRFVMDARSSVGASGLMQVMPATARWTAKKIGIAGFTPDQLHDRDMNIAIGTGYLKLVLDDFAGSMPMAAAAYNAGPSRPRNWRNGPVLDAAIWAENVPFTETRDYVKKVLANTTMYAAILTGQPQSIKARLGLVGPREAALPEPSRDLP
ncbi:lytic transglycosylase domain-containing protein [Ramlibacter algicola]|uniref:Lytic transglycosylase domain-containing protein n=1 Tax=Ramlibacter algicola TaxID=2795217 RepID=A0A934Q5A0_9BURK|nr:lytic transglycosylase domain-containing protein [Ramlibacter algicola]MBK0394727.1 lytic transglycosylase domain-containing protein [Ramlibacter algicola]